MQLLKTLLLLFVVVAIPFHSCAQDEEKECGKTKDKKVLKLLDEAKKEHDWTKSQELIEQIVSDNPKCAEAYLLLGKRALFRNSFQTDLKLKKADIEENLKIFETAYKKLIEVCPDYSVDPYVKLGTYYFTKNNYEDAIKYFKSVKKFEKANQDDIHYADSCIRIARLLKNPVPFDPKPLPGVCSEKDEYLPIVSPDNEIAFYTRSYDKVRRGDLLPTRVEEFSFSLRDSISGKFDEGKEMSPPFNSSFNEGGASVTIDNNHLYFTICKPAGSYVNCDIYYCDKVNGRWGEIKNLGTNVNTPKSWDSQPSISRDGNTLYFASDRDTAQGAEIFTTTKNDSGKWSKPVKIQGPINTKGNEKSPFLHPDDRTLYYSSDGEAGMGGFDIFISRKDSLGKWGTPKNIGYPINSEFDDLGFFVSTDGKTGYFASNKLKGKGGWDVYSFPLYEGARPERVLFVKGELEKNENDTAVTQTNVELVNAKTKEVTKLNVDSASGKFVGVVNFKDDYILTMKREGYAFESRYFNKSDSTLDKPVSQDMPLTKLEVGGVFTLKNIFFKSNSADLTDESVSVIAEFVKFLEENPHVKVEIRGHTDNVGDDKKNLALSTDRAFTVFELASKSGIDKTRLSFKGFGKTKPVAPNDSEENRSKNRRTEFVIVAK